MMVSQTVVPTDVESNPGPSNPPIDNTEPAPAKTFGVGLKQLAFIDQEQLDTPMTVKGAAGRPSRPSARPTSAPR